MMLYSWLIWYFWMKTCRQERHYHEMHKSYVPQKLYAYNMTISFLMYMIKWLCIYTCHNSPSALLCTQLCSCVGYIPLYSQTWLTNSSFGVEVAHLFGLQSKLRKVYQSQPQGLLVLKTMVSRVLYFICVCAFFYIKFYLLWLCSTRAQEC